MSVVDEWPQRLRVRALTRADALGIAAWRYEGRWRVYDPAPDDALLDAADGYWAVGGDGDTLVGFCCVGAEARVPGLPEPAPEIRDIGVGMDPRWVGAGHGGEFGQTVVDHFNAWPGVHGLRAVVQHWNERSLRFVRRLGFVEVGRHISRQGRRPVEYVILERRGTQGPSTSRV